MQYVSVSKLSKSFTAVRSIVKAGILGSMMIALSTPLVAQSFTRPRRPTPPIIVQPTFLKTLNFFPADLKYKIGPTSSQVSGTIYNTGNKSFPRHIQIKVETFEIQHPFVKSQRSIQRKYTRTLFVRGTFERKWYKNFQVSIPNASVPLEGYIKVTVDSDNKIAETDEADNTGHVSVRGLY